MSLLATVYVGYYVFLYDGVQFCPREGHGDCDLHLFQCGAAVLVGIRMACLQYAWFLAVFLVPVSLHSRHTGLYTYRDNGCDVGAGEV